MRWLAYSLAALSISISALFYCVIIVVEFLERQLRYVYEDVIY
jgi:hypothetical protein